METAQPFYFGSAQRPLLGWLHLPADEPRQDVGIVLCAPLGYEAICTHRTFRHFAQAAAKQGFAALRFDYDGVGDSAGNDTDPGRMQAWTESIRIAVDTLQQSTGVQRICLVGMRLGATLALIAAQDRSAVGGVVLINTVTDGRRYLRELRALALTSATALPSGSASDNDLRAAAGFVTTAETRLSLGQLQIAGDALKSVPPRALLLDRPDMPADEKLAKLLVQLGSHLQRGSFSGYAEMMLDAHESCVPHDSIRESLEWIRSWSQPAGPDLVTTNTPGADRCSMSWSAGNKAGTIRERVVRPDSAGKLFGIVTEPDVPALSPSLPPTPVLLLLNSGAVHHVGPNRLYVSIARQAALYGLRTIRVDLPGLGDSAADTDEAENQVYPRTALHAVAQVVEYARRNLGASEIHSAGICSGAYHSLKAAVNDLPLQSIVVINPLTFFWTPEVALAPPAFQDIAEVMRYQRTALSAASLRKLLTGKVDVMNLAGIFRRYTGRRLRNMARNTGRTLGLRLNDDLVAELRKLKHQGTRIHFVFARTDPGLPMLLDMAGQEVRRQTLTGSMFTDLIDNADHTFTQWEAQKTLIDIVTNTIVQQGKTTSP